MERIAVTSSNIAEVGYDKESQTMEILFSNGRIYQYFDVPDQTYHDLLTASSHGQFLAREIKGRFRYARV